MSRESTVEGLSRRFFGVTPVRLVIGLAVLAAILTALFLLDRRGGDAEVGPLDSQAPEVGEPAPRFALRDPEGNVVELGDFEGQPVWVNFWATWCTPCREELPDIQELAAEFESEGLVVLAVNQGEGAEPARDFWEELGLDLPILLDRDEAVSRQYWLIGLPNNFFIDRDGVLRSFQHGFLTEEQMRERLTSLGLP